MCRKYRKLDIEKTDHRTGNFYKFSNLSETTAAMVVFNWGEETSETTSSQQENDFNWTWSGNRPFRFHSIGPLYFHHDFFPVASDSWCFCHLVFSRYQNPQNETYYETYTRWSKKRILHEDGDALSVLITNDSSTLNGLSRNTIWSRWWGCLIKVLFSALARKGWRRLRLWQWARYGSSVVSLKMLWDLTQIAVVAFDLKLVLRVRVFSHSRLRYSVSFSFDYSCPANPSHYKLPDLIWSRHCGCDLKSTLTHTTSVS